jgi:hypothetical protein
VSRISGMIESVIRSLLASPAWSEQRPHDINNGSCEDFQQEALSLLVGSGAEEVCDATFPEIGASPSHTPPFALPGHFWIFHEGRHYDAEAPAGVDRWQDLPIYARTLPT